jgi:hypothetical protein
MALHRRIGMPGKVFISCGQRPPHEKEIAESVAKLLKDEFKLKPYLAFKIQSFDDIMTITKELCSSDYYLFIDFKRNPENLYDLPCSLFTHQELALAHHLGFENIISLQQQDAPLEGFLRYVLSNPEIFTNKEDLLNKTLDLVRIRKWSASYSRNLIIKELGFKDPLFYQDHTGKYFERVWQVKVENKRPDAAAIGTVCILDYIEMKKGTRIRPFDRSYLKWAGQIGYERTILPKDSGDIDIFSLHADEPGIFLHSMSDTPREPIVKEDGEYQLFFKLFSQGFPLLEFSVNINLIWIKQNITSWDNKTIASLVTE